jgi:MoxR-like ATPase
MASTKQLRNGMSVIINSGPYQGLTAKVIDSIVQPDGTPNQRKILVEVQDPDSPWQEYIIPKQLTIPGLVPPHMYRPQPQQYFPQQYQQPVQQFPQPVQQYAQPVPQYAQPVQPDVPVQPVRSLPTSLDDPSLDRYRPSRSNILRQYVSRDLPGGKTDIDVMLSYWKRRDKRGYSNNVGLVGDTQSGKTMLVEVMAHVISQHMGLTKPLPVFTLSGDSAITDHDLFGQYRPNANGDLVWMEGIVSLAAHVGGILYLDEINAMPGNVTSALHPVTDDRRQFVNIRRPMQDEHGNYTPEVVNVNPNLWILCTYNPGYAGMSKTNEAFANRFRWLPWDYDEEVERKLIKSPTVRLLGQALRLARETRAITTPVGTSALQRLEEDLTYLEVDYALWAFMGQFTSKAEKAKVDAIITDRSIRAMLEAEYAKEDTPADAPQSYM